jgi:stage V sporulation protein B
VVIGLMTLINAVQTSGVPQAIAKFGAEGRFSTADLFFTGGILQVGSGIVLAVGLFVLADPVATLLGDDALVAPLQVAALAFPTYALLTLLVGIEGGRGMYVRQSAMLSVFAIAKAVIAVVLGLVVSLVGAIVGYVLAPLVGALVFRGRPSLRDGNISPLRPIIVYSVPLLVLSVLSIAYLSVDLFVVKALLADPSSAGYYTAAQNVARVPYYLAAGLAAILLPAIARAAAADMGHASRVVRESLRFGSLIIVPVSILLIAQGQDVVELLFGDSYSAAVTPLRLLTAAMGIFAFVSLLTSVLAAVSRTWLAVLAAAVGLLTSAVVAVSIVPGQGMQGAAEATLLGALVAFAISIGATYRVLHFEVPWFTFVRVTAASGVVGLVAFNLHGNVALVVGLPLLGLIFIGLLVVMREVTADDWRRLRALVPAR